MLDISVIVPAYNAEEWIDRAIRSVLNQTVMPAEILVVDDGSSDNTAQIVGQYGSAVRYFHQDNAGPSTARNKAIMNARCEWIAFLDSDDEWLPHKIESQVRILEKNPDLKWCGCACENFSNGIISSFSLAEDLKQELAHHTELHYFSALLKGVRFGTQSIVIHESVFDEFGGFDPKLRSGEDIDMWCRIALKYPRIGYCFDPCWFYHQDNPNSITRRVDRCRDLNLKSVCRNMRSAIELGPEVANEFRPYARMKVMEYLIIEAGTGCFIHSDTIKDVKTLFPLTYRERATLRILRSLPKPIALKAAVRLMP